MPMPIESSGLSNKYTSYKTNRNTLHNAAEVGDIRRLQRYIEEGLERGESEGVTLHKREDLLGLMPLHLASEAGQIEATAFLIKMKVDLDALDNYRVAALHLASVAGKTNVVQMLLDAGARINPEDEEGDMPVHWAATQGHAEVLQLLISRGSPIDPVNRRGWTPLHRAAYNGVYDAVKTLISLGGSMHARNCDGNTPLHLACFMNRIPIIQQLLTLGCSMFCTNSGGQTPYDLCISEAARQLMDDWGYSRLGGAEGEHAKAELLASASEIGGEAMDEDEFNNELYGDPSWIDKRKPAHDGFPDMAPMDWDDHDLDHGRKGASKEDTCKHEDSDPEDDDMKQHLAMLMNMSKAAAAAGRTRGQTPPRSARRSSETGASPPRQQQQQDGCRSPLMSMADAGQSPQHRRPWGTNNGPKSGGTQRRPLSHSAPISDLKLESQTSSPAPLVPSPEIWVGGMPLQGPITTGVRRVVAASSSGVAPSGTVTASPHMSLSGLEPTGKRSLFADYSGAEYTAPVQTKVLPKPASAVQGPFKPATGTVHRPGFNSSGATGREPTGISHQRSQDLNTITRQRSVEPVSLGHWVPPARTASVTPAGFGIPPYSPGKGWNGKPNQQLTSPTTQRHLSGSGLPPGSEQRPGTTPSPPSQRPFNVGMARRDAAAASNVSPLRQPRLSEPGPPPCGESTWHAHSGAPLKPSPLTGIQPSPPTGHRPSSSAAHGSRPQLVGRFSKF